jgi:hypothetical protein
VGFILALFFAQFFVPFPFYNKVWDGITVKASIIFYSQGHIFYSLAGIYLWDEWI